MKKQILIGVDLFEKVIEGDFFYIDKTLFIKELLENRGDVTLITRPRRFGKTMNMSMLRTFFDVHRDGKRYFNGLKIMEYPDIIDKYLNKNPVIFMTLKNISADNFNDAFYRIRSLISTIYQQFLYLYESDILDERKKKDFYKYYDKVATAVELRESLQFLSTCLQTYHKKRVIILIDEYDAPIDNAYRKGFYPDMIDFMRDFLGSVFKSNDFLEFGVLSGVLRIAKESLFSSFNNPKIYGIMNKPLSTSFGFTEEEVKESCEIYDIPDNFEEVKKWYDGYRFGGQEIYNPWSITNYLKDLEIDDFWINTGSIQILKDVFYKGDNSLKDDFAKLLTGSTISMSLEESFSYPIHYVTSDKFWSLMLNAGYIKPCNGAKKEAFNAEFVNLEVKYFFNKNAREWLRLKRSEISNIIIEFVDYLREGDVEKVSAILNNELLNNPSCHDFKRENSYHMFIYGILLATSNDYTVYSNLESGKGRSDCLIKPDDKSKHAIIIEFKHVKDASNLKEEAINGLKQIEEKAYIHTLKKEGYENIRKYSIAFYKKKCEVVS